MSRALIVYASSHGHTGRIAARIAGELEAAKVPADLVDAGAKDTVKAIDTYDLIVVGASIHAGKHEREVVRWVERHRDALLRRPSAFFSVSLSAIGDDEASQAEAAGYVRDFQARTGWTAGRTATFAGALQYREYNWLLRRVIRHIARGKGIATDTSRDHDYTDWDAVEAFAGRLAQDAGAAEDHGPVVRPAPDPTATSRG